MNGNVYLGCGQKDYIPTRESVHEKSELIHRLETAHTDSKDGKEIKEERKQAKAKGTAMPVGEKPLPKAWHYDMCGHAEQCVERYLELSGKDRSTLKATATPCIDDHQIAPEDFEKKGVWYGIDANQVASHARGDLAGEPCMPSQVHFATPLLVVACKAFCCGTGMAQMALRTTSSFSISWLATSDATLLMGLKTGFPAFA